MSATKTDLYKILNTTPDASPAELKTAHREAVLKYHPDIVGQTPESLEKFREVQEAYKVLSTPDLKKEYDLTLSKQTSTIPTQSKAKVATGSASAHIYGLQKQNFQENIMGNGAEWASNLPKYRLEKWKKVPIEEKKRQRIRPIWNLRSLSMSYAPYVIATCCTIGVCFYLSRPGVMHASFVRDIQPLLANKKKHSDAH